MRKNPSNLYDENYLKSEMYPGGVNRWEDNGVFYETAVTISMLAKHLDIQSVLDVGCGRGYVVQHLRNLGIKADGVEYGDCAVKNSVCGAIKGDLTSKLPIPDRSYDFVICAGVLSHIPGKFISNAVSELARIYRKAIWTNIQLAYQEEQKHHLTFWPTKKWIAMFNSHDLEESKEFHSVMKRSGSLANNVAFSAIWKRLRCNP